MEPGALCSEGWPPTHQLRDTRKGRDRAKREQAAPHHAALAWKGNGGHREGARAMGERKEVAVGVQPLPRAHPLSAKQAVHPPPLPHPVCGTSTSMPRTMDGPTRRMAALKSSAPTQQASPSQPAWCSAPPRPCPPSSSCCCCCCCSPPRSPIPCCRPPPPAPPRGCWLPGMPWGAASRCAAERDSACRAASLATAARSAPL